MKRTPLKRGTKGLKRSGFKTRSGFSPKKRVAGQISGKKGGVGSLPKGAKIGIRGSSLWKEGKSEVALTKKRIQALLRELAIRRDGGCIMRKHLGMLPSSYRECDEVLQAEHLHTRGSSGSFGDMRNIVCLCRRHHIFFKPQYSQLYWEIIEQHLGPEGWAWYKRIRDDHRAHPMRLWDWTQVELSLKQDLYGRKQRGEIRVE